MADLTLRNNKGTALTFDEMDSNFLALDSDITDIKVGANEYVTKSTSQTITGSKYFNASTSFDSVVILETLSLGGAGSQFVASAEDTVKLKFVTEYTSNTIQSGMGHISEELWLASIDSSDSAGVRRIGFYLDVPDGGALDAASQSASTNARVYITLSGMTVKGLLSGDSANFSGKVTANEFHGDGSNLTGVTSYVKADFDSDFGTKSTSDLTEGTNLYYTSSRADSDAKNAISVSGSLSYDPVTGIISYTDLDSDRTVTQIRGLFSAAGDLSYDSSTGKFTNTYVDSERTVAQIRGMFNAGGDLSYDSSTGKFSFTESPTYTTSDFDSDFSTKSTSNLSEGTNKYYRTVYFDSDLGDKTTDNLAEGSTNLYYTTARADSDAKNAISAGGDLSYNPETGVVSYTDSERSVAQIRGMFNAGGDLSYDSALGKFSFTERTNDSVRALFSAGGDLSYDSSTGKFSYTDSERSVAQIRRMFNAGGDLSYDSTSGQFSYTQRTDSAIRVLISASGDLSYDANSGVISYTDSARSADQIKGLFDAGGDLSFNPSTGVFSYSQRTDSAVRLLISAAGDLSYNPNTGVISYTDSDRSAAQIKGLFSAAGSLSYDSTTGEFSYTDSDRTASQIKGLFSAAGNLSYNSTTGEFSYTDSERTVAQIRGMFNAGGDLTYDSALGKFSFTQTLYSKANFDSDFGAKTTSDLTEGTNLYYTTARFDSDFGDNNTDQLSEGSTNLYYTTARSDSDFDVRLATKTTTNVAEGTNLYYTTARADSDARQAVSATDAGGDGSFSYNPANGVFTYTGPSATETRAHFSGGTGVAINSGIISIGQPVGQSDNVVFALIIADSVDVQGGYITKLSGQDLTYDSAKINTLSSTSISSGTLSASTSITLGSTVAYQQNYGGLSYNENSFYGDSQNTTFFFASNDSTNTSTAIALGIKNQFRHYIGVTGTADSNQMVIGYPSNNFGLRIRKNVGESPYDLSGGTALVSMDSNGDVKLFSSTNSTAKTNGSLVLVGGLGIGGNLRGTDIFATGNVQANGNFIGDVTGTVSDISNHNTGDLTEGSNLYYTTSRFDSDLGASSTTNLSEGSNLYYTTARADSDAKNAIDVNDGGGDGSLSYNPATGIISYQGPSASETRAHFSAGTGVSYSSGTGVISIGQSVGTSDSVEFSAATINGDLVITGNFTVQGTQNITSQNDLRITNAIIKVADSNAQDTVDMGVVGRYSTDGGSTIRRSGFVRDATNGEWYVFTNLIQDGLDSSVPDQTINFNDPSFELGTFNFGALRGSYLGFDSDFRVFSTNYTAVTSNVTATSSQRIAADTTGGSFTVTLPASPSTGDYVKIIDVGNFSTNSLIIGRNGSTIEGYSDDFELDIGQSIIELIYINSTWQVYSSIGQRGETGPAGANADSASFASTNEAIAFAVALG